MIRLPGDTEPGRFKEHCYENAVNKVMILDSAPTSSEPLITEGNLGYFNNKIYIVLGGILKEFSTSDTV